MQTIEIRTSQNVVIEYELAALRDRIMAFVLDFILISILYSILLVLLRNTLSRIIYDSGYTMNAIYVLLPIFLYALYCFSFEFWIQGRTLGKMALGIKVIRLDGREPGITDYLLRAVFLLPDVIFSMGAIAAFLVGTTPYKQRLGDLTANTTLIRVKPSVLYKLTDFLRRDQAPPPEIAYPGVKNLNEQDMILVKSALTRFQSHRNEAHREVVNDLARRLADILQVEQPRNPEAFLKRLLHDYIALTR